MDEKIYTVTELTRTIKETLEQSEAFTGIWLKGEIYNLTYHSSGHIYFTLKDDNAVISVTFFKYANRKLTFRLENGMSIFTQGSISLYEKRGSYQLNVTSVKLEGEGELQKRIEQLKKKLTAEGIFNPEFKKSLPFLPRRVGVVTSPTGAAIQDIMKVAIRRFPDIEILLAPAKVQGDDAAATIVRGIQELNRPEHRIDVIIAGRGGGSFEDLMPFNEESVVRSFFESRVPVISAVGHQIDHPLSDDAADAAAPTPSAAAEMAVPVKKELIDETNHLLERSEMALQSRVLYFQNRIDHILSRRIFQEPMEILSNRELLLKDIEQSIQGKLKEVIASKKEKLLSLPDISLLLKNRLSSLQHRFQISLQAIDQLSPLQVMRRGYAVLKNSDNVLIRSVDQASAGSPLEVYLVDGTLNCMIDSINKGETIGKK